MYVGKYVWMWENYETYQIMLVMDAGGLDKGESWGLIPVKW